MQKLEKIIESLIKAVCIFLLSLIVFGLIGIVCLNVYNDQTRESIHQRETEYTIGSAQLKGAIYTLQDVLNGSEQLNNVNTNEFLNPLASHRDGKNVLFF